MVRSCLVICSISIISCASAWAQTTTRVSVDSSGAQGNSDSGYEGGVAISSDGRFVAFQSFASNLVPGDTNGAQDIFVHDRMSGTTRRVSVDSSGTQANGYCYWPSISSDGRYVAFSSHSSNLVPGDTNGTDDIFVHDRVSGTTTRVSVSSSGVQGNLQSGVYGLSMSSDGRYVAFASDATSLVPGDTNGDTDVFVHDTVTGITERVSVDSSGAQSVGAYGSFSPSISSDGRYVAFQSYAVNLVPGDTNLAPDVFVHDRVSGTTTRVSVNSIGRQGNGYSGSPIVPCVSISSDGLHVAFVSSATNLAPGDTNGLADVFVRDLVAGTTTRASVDSSGAQGNGESQAPSISSDGRYVAFYSLATNLVAGDTDGVRDVFVHDMLNGSTTRVSVDSNGGQGNRLSWLPSISGDGRCVGFSGPASNLVPGDTNVCSDVFVRDSGPASAFTAFCFGDGTDGTCPCSTRGAPGHGCENSAATGGALLSGSGFASLSSDTVQVSSSGELPTAWTTVLQGSTVIAPTSFGDGIWCAGGALRRLYVKQTVAGAITAPQTGDASIAARSATLGDPIPPGATRIYQAYYRDSNVAFCSGGFNATNAIAIAWGS